MPSIFPIVPSYGAKVSLTFPHQLKQTVQGYDYVNVSNIHPLLEFDISRSLMYEIDKEAIVNLFETLQGSQDILLFEDFTDNSATHTLRVHGKPEYSATFDYDRGSTLGIVVRDLDNNLRLAKRYGVADNGVSRVITYPKTFQMYRGVTPVAVTVEEGTGIITGGQDGDTWTGTFYVPVRFVDDDFTFRKVGRNEYAFNSLKLREVKTYNIGPVGDVFNSTTENYFALGFNFNSETSKKFNTLVTSYDNEFEDREQQFDYLQQRFTLTQRILLDSSDIQYLISLYRSFLGCYRIFKYYRFEDARTFDVSLETPLEITANQFKPHMGIALYEVNNLVLKSCSLLDVAKLRTTFCKTWELTPKDNNDVYRITDFDNDVIIGANRFSPINTFQSYAISTSNSFEADNTDLDGVLTEGWIEELELVAGRFEDANITVSLSDWYAQTVFKILFTGYIGKQSIYYTKNGAKTFKLEGVSVVRDLNVKNSNITSSRCRHRFLEQGYGKCDRPFVIDTSPDVVGSVQVRSNIVSVTSNVIINAGIGVNWAGYINGTILFETGNLQGTSVLIKSASGTELNLSFGMRVLPEVGDQILVTRNCDKSTTACEQYNNMKNFGGFPRLPGIDQLIRPAE